MVLDGSLQDGIDMHTIIVCALDTAILTAGDTNDRQQK